MSWAGATPTSVASLFDVANSASLVLTSVPFVSGRLYVLITALDRSVGGGGPGDLSAGYSMLHGATDRTSEWTFAAQSALFDDSTERIAAYWLIASVTETVDLTYDDADTSTAGNREGILIEVASGFHATTPISQSAGAVAAAALSLSVSLASAPAASSLGLSGWRNSDATSDTLPRSGWTELADVQGTGTGSDSGGLEAQYTATAEQTASASVSATNRDWGGVHLEIAAAAGGTTFNQSVAAVAVGVASLVTTLGFSVSVAAASIGSAMLGSVVTRVQSIAAVAVGVVGLGKKMFIAMVGVANPVAAIGKGSFKLLGATAMGSSSLSPSLLSLVVVGATAVGVATVNGVQLLVQNLAAVAVGVGSIVTQFIAGLGVVIQSLVGPRHHRRRR